MLCILKWFKAVRVFFHFDDQHLCKTKVQFRVESVPEPIALENFRTNCTISDETFYHEVWLQTSHYNLVTVSKRS